MSDDNAMEVKARAAKARAANAAEANAARAFATAWNRLDVSALVPLLSEDVCYGSQSVLSELEGKSAVLTYLRAKMQTMKDAAADKQVYAEMGQTQTYPAGHACVLIAQGDRDDLSALVLFEIEGDLVTRIDLCTIAPHPSSARRTGDYPK